MLTTKYCHLIIFDPLIMVQKKYLHKNTGLIWRFLKMGVPPVIIHLNGIFSTKTIQLWGFPPFMEPPIYYRLRTVDTWNEHFETRCLWGMPCSIYFTVSRWGPVAKIPVATRWFLQCNALNLGA